MHNRRHQLIILGSYQRRIIATAVMTSILLINLTLIAWLLLDPQLISRIDTVDTIAVALIELVVIGLIFVVSLFASNRIAGPMYAFDKVLKQIHGGDLSARLHLRPGDICHNVADEMNATFDDLQNRISVIKETVNRLQQLEGISNEQQASIDELQAQLEHFSKQQGSGE